MRLTGPSRGAARRQRPQARCRAAQRERIGRELQDTLLQSATGLVLNFQVALNRLPEGSAERQAMQSLLDAADRGVDDARARVTSLRVDASGANLGRHLREFGESLALHGLTGFAWEGSGPEWPLTPESQDQLLMIVREAIRNAFRHAHARQVTLRLGRNHGAPMLSVSDDGAGFDVDAALLEAGPCGHRGLLGMRARASAVGARLDVASAPGGGTRVTVCLPAGTARAASARGSLGTST